MKNVLKLLTIILCLNLGITYALETAPRIGDYYQGGIVLWLDPLKQFQHGLIVDVKNRPGTYAWDNAGIKKPLNAINDGPYGGKANTLLMSENLGNRAEAAKACVNNNSGGYNDWYLPSGLEFIETSRNPMTINYSIAGHGGDILISQTYYWTSNEDLGSLDTQNYAVAFNFGSFTAGAHYVKTDKLSVRCIRAF